MSEIIDYASLPTPKAWIGYDRTEFSRGCLVVNICGACAGVREAEAVAARLKCKTFRTLCPKHIAERTARITGEKL